MDNVFLRYTSRKFIQSILGVALILLDGASDNFNLTSEQNLAITAFIVSFIVAEGIKDVKAVQRNNTEKVDSNPTQEPSYVYGE